MYRFGSYTILFFVICLFQILFFNNLSVSIALSPLIYVAFIILLPLQITRFALLMVGLGLGAVMDWTMGLGGINTIATLLIAFARPYVLNFSGTRDTLSGSGVPSESRLGEIAYIKYVVILILLHHSIFFALESLSLRNWTLYLLRLSVSGCITTLFVWLIGRSFVAIVFRKAKR